MKFKAKKYTEEQLRQAIKSCRSIHQVILNLGLGSPTGGVYYSIHRNIKALSLDISDFTGQGWSKNQNYIRRPTTEYLVENCPYGIGSHTLKLRLYKEGFKIPKCELCGITSWQEKPISFHLDHINGRHDDNRIENLRILCPNCHSQTDTYSGKNQGKARY